MLCKIYQRTYHLKGKYYPNIFYTDSLDEEHWYPIKISYLKAHDRPEFWCFSPWKERVVNFNPESFDDIEWCKSHIVEMCRNIKYVQFATREDEIPSHDFYDTSVVQFKVVDGKGYIVNMESYIHNYLKEKKRRYQENNDLFSQQYFASLRYYWRHPRTTNLKRQTLSKDEKQFYEENGWKIKERVKRNPSKLPDLFDDKFIHVDKCWKSQTRQPRQYMRNRKAKRKRIYGEEYRNIVG